MFCPARVQYAVRWSQAFCMNARAHILDARTSVCKWMLVRYSETFQQFKSGGALPLCTDKISQKVLKEQDGE